MIVVNSFAGLRWQWLRSLHIPLLGELLALFTVMNVMYENTTSPRRTALVHKFDQAAKTGSGLKGCLVTIEQTPTRSRITFVSAPIPRPSARAEPNPCYGTLVMTTELGGNRL